MSEPVQFRSKEISKSNVVDDMVEANKILYKPGEHPDHVVVIKYAFPPPIPPLPPERFCKPQGEDLCMS